MQPPESRSLVVVFVPCLAACVERESSNPCSFQSVPNGADSCRSTWTQCSDGSRYQVDSLRISDTSHVGSCKDNGTGQGAFNLTGLCADTAAAESGCGFVLQ